MIYYMILYPYLLSFNSYNNLIFRIFPFLFAFVGNKLNQESIAKGAKEDQKKEETGIVMGPYCRHDIRQAATRAAAYAGAGDIQQSGWRLAVSHVTADFEDFLC